MQNQIDDVYFVHMPVPGMINPTTNLTDSLDLQAELLASESEVASSGNNNMMINSIEEVAYEPKLWEQEIMDAVSVRQERREK